MKDQHTHIKGYRDLSEEEVRAMNEFKAIASLVGTACLDRREHILNTMPYQTIEEAANRKEALRWLEAGELQAQQAFMSLIRSIALPTTF